MEDLRVALGIEWRAPIDATVAAASDRTVVVEADVYSSVYSDGGPPAIELVPVGPRNPARGNWWCELPSPGLLDRPGSPTSSQDLYAHGWPCASEPWAGPEETIQGRFTLQQSPARLLRRVVRHRHTTAPTPTCCQRRAAKGQTMSISSERQTKATNRRTPDADRGHPTRADGSPVRPHERDRSHFARTSTARGTTTNEGRAIIRPGLARERPSASRNPNAGGDPDRPTLRGDLRHREARIRHRRGHRSRNSPGYPRYLFRGSKKAASSRRRCAAPTR